MSSKAASTPIELVAAAARAVAYLCRTQGPPGSWTDFWLPVGTSDAWVTAYVGLALLQAAECNTLPTPARDAARKAAAGAGRWLLDQRRPLRGWGYNASVPPDADSTACALSLLARLKMAVPADAIRFLEEHRDLERRFRTFKWRRPSHQWRQPTADVTAACLRALFDVGVLDRGALRDAWLTALGSQQSPDGTWVGYWWPSPWYPTAVTLESWVLAGRPSLDCPSLPENPEPASAFELACMAIARTAIGEDALPALLRLAQLQDSAGSWASGPILRLPPADEPDPAPERVLLTTDSRCVFTTSTALKAVCTGLARWRPRHAVTVPRRPRRQPGRSISGHKLHALVEQAALTLGFEAPAARQLRDTFAIITARSLAEPSPWPSPQLSSLSAGLPLEFSVTAGRDEPPALRYTAETGDPYLPPYARARSGLQAFQAVITHLGYEQAWTRVLPGVRSLVSARLPAPDGLRFWVWTGVDCIRPAPGAVAVPLLKVYLNLLHRELGSSRERLEACMRAASIPISDRLRQSLDLLDAHGFLHECGFGLGPSGRIAFKLYYELQGWQPDIVGRVLEDAGLPSALEDVCPEIPGLLKQSLARKRRAGIALRLDPDDGSISELTTAAAFLPPMLPDREVDRRVRAWLHDNGWDTSAYEALSDLLLSVRHGPKEGSAGMHSLFTRTLSRHQASATVYLRPYIPTGGHTTAADVGPIPEAMYAS